MNDTKYIFGTIIAILLFANIGFAYDYSCYNQDQLAVLSNISVANNFTAEQNQSWFEIYGYLCDYSYNLTQYNETIFNVYDNIIANFSNFYTQEELDALLGNTTDIDLSPYATKDSLSSYKEETSKSIADIDAKITGVSDIEQRTANAETNSWLFPLIFFIITIVIIVVITML